MTDTLQRILFAEDEPDIAAILELALEAVGGFEITPCANGNEAVERAPSARADLILLDVMMPGLDGPATLGRLRELPETATTPIIFLTAKAQRQEVEHLKSLGALGVIAKPFDPMTLSDSIRALWATRNG